MAREKHDYSHMTCDHCGRDLGVVKERKITFFDVKEGDKYRTFVFCGDKCKREHQKTT